MAEAESVEAVKEDTDLINGIIVQGDQEFPVEIALKADPPIPVFRCKDCSSLHIGPDGSGEFDPSEVEKDLDELMAMIERGEETKTPKERIIELHRFMKEAEIRGMLPEKSEEVTV